MRVCLISNQIASWGKTGGFGTATRAIGSGLAKRGLDVSAVVPIQGGNGQKEIEILDGITVYGVKNWDTLTSGRIFKMINADIYHSQNPTIASFHANKSMPNAIHIVTCRNPKSFKDYLIELKHSSMTKRLLSPISTWFYEASPWVKESVRNADKVFVPAPSYLKEKVKQIYGSNIRPLFVPSPLDIPVKDVIKAQVPTIIFVGRWDRIKRVEKFFELARNNPSLHFIALGCSNEKKYDSYLRNTYRKINNLEMPGFIPRFGNRGIAEYYEKAWIIVNTSPMEGLPYTFLESLAYECAILSEVNPDNFASNYGYWAQNGSFQEGLDWLLDKNRWQVLGKSGAEYVIQVFNEENSINQHLKHYGLN